LEKAAAALKLDHTPAWEMAMRQVEILKEKYLELSNFLITTISPQRTWPYRVTWRNLCGRSSSTTIVLPAAQTTATGAT